MVIKRFTYQVRGKVQGVFFRVHTVNAAERYGISGYVQNLPREGTGPGDEQRVAGEAQGEEDALDKFFTEVKRGPEAAVVRALEKNEIPVKEGETVFKKVRWGEQPPV
ncbi:Acylphosphatase family protein [Ascodesmis nigricans]|uniref:acylphosphatase n=1 Tax=Ascodesmis nigricans TaxID=341454 RepID=A0A4S2N4Y2_9PEZI|nr:Acylphosphatase family protein [Ascodesmis nigricans]